MGILERKIRHRQEVRDRILQAAWQLVELEGWSALSIRRIADAIEYSIPVIYSHFENKDAILLEFSREGFRRLAQHLQTARDEQDNPGQQLMAMAQAYWNFAFDNQEFYQLMFGLGIPACDTVKKVAEMKQFSDVIFPVLQQAIATSSHPETSHLLKFHTFWSILHGLVSIQMIGKDNATDPIQQLVLEDAIGGFIKALA
ncbi:TetR/AcrR family transcriptional regulator [Larkinella knui]|uniref:TetR/AcrR family transcriptional regulator n=1 Tax=Larkinella knui TaxID=2025310 RepID=A0A3P1CHL2_9BACT|nr:TetR/AcrR family transcriptional regulator [Larkinella knui]RRB12374.1 TetR/AcrR family transcriptional regulator [Larkinella knui]